MDKIWATLIISGRKTFEEVPDFLKAKVKAELLRRGYNTDGNKLN